MAMALDNPLEMLKQEKIAVLYGGNSAERDVSLKSGQAIAKGLEEAGFNVTLIDTKTVPLTDLLDKNIDRVFIALHGRGGEDGCLQGALEYLGIPYTGSNVLGSSLSMDKVRSKQIFKACDIPTAPFTIVNKADFATLSLENILAELGGRVMVKPANEGSSIGMAQAKTIEQLRNALIEAFGFDRQVLLEAWIDGPEYTVTILGDKALPAIHMETPREFYDYEAKYQSTSTQYHCPCGLNKREESEIQALSIKAFNATGAQGWGRVDIMQNQRGEWQVLEVNTVPGMTETSLVPKAAKVFGLNFSELVTQILQLSVKE
ncbi:D-alanine--D-alanine ligase [Colwellia psychrerythraea]|uniref:D-alanine--D-alanine ligase n=1 Tax=Colwellia psychrerythraea TaxID=28229 RepID=A0A099KXF7_COLPS|nr:D-alanine--D-alanine ligase [Colwellia psychrerythraea]KGJ95281.1 D-alanine--D-alanine ligase [Colwellia psychrerythraea]